MPASSHQASASQVQPDSNDVSVSVVSVNPSKVKVSTACGSCRSRKIRCHPSAVPGSSSTPRSSLGPCTECTLSGIADQCSYPPSKDRAAFSRQYVQNLETRMQALEELCEGFKEILGDKLAHAKRKGSTSSAGEPKSRTASTDPVETPHVPHNVSTHQQGQPVTDTGQWVYDDDGNRRWIGSYNTLSVLESFSPTNLTGASHPELTPSDDSLNWGNGKPITAYFEPVAGSGRTFDRLLPDLNRISFPDGTSMAAMITAFFAEIHPVLPVIPEHRFHELHSMVMEHRRQGQPLPQHSRGFLSVLFAILALGERVLVTSQAWRRERLRVLDGKEPLIIPGEAKAGVRWYETAHIVHLSNLGDVNHFQVQCLTLLAAFQASVNAMPQAWLLSGQALRVAQDLGLHRVLVFPDATYHHHQTHSRCWWAVYGLDRLLSLSLGRPLGIEDIDIDNPLPLPLPDSALYAIDKQGAEPPDPDRIDEPETSSMSGFIALTKLCQIAGRVAHLLHRQPAGRAFQRQAVESLDDALHEWLTNQVPEKYKHPSSVRSVQVLAGVLSNTYLTLVITLHRHFLASARATRAIEPSSLSLTRCISAARSVVHVAASDRALVSPSHHLALSCQIVWSSAIILLMCEAQSGSQPIVDAVIDQVQSCRTSLKALEVVFPGSKRLVELLDAVQLSASSPSPPTGMLSQAGGKKRKVPEEAVTHQRRILKESRRRAERVGPAGYKSLPAQTFSLWSNSSPPVDSLHVLGDSSAHKASSAPNVTRAPAVSTISMDRETPMSTTDHGINGFRGPPTLDRLFPTYLADTGLDSAAFWEALKEAQPNTREHESSFEVDLPVSTWQSALPEPSGEREDSQEGRMSTLWEDVDLETFNWSGDPWLPFNT
ncbi:fungal-specific transcription factor domain-domain-containing protein [Naematelia encephala]|uniref:Fungal-specific transcription factor domain-domain-containing protein n=1 Tax=Naematelia encephala TaxID=71784 RepID=A0A1Y2APS0_9TREE|nr:fungal-specific transcription factor domain-domain-containing protein [Naematelia encephala]